MIMEKIFKRRILWGIIIFVFFAGFGLFWKNEVSCEAESNNINMDDGTKKKVISVIFDNSTSMCRNDDDPKEYTPRWVEADYALKALAAMMNEGDELNIYFIKDDTGKSKKINIGKNLETAIDEIDNYMKNMILYDGTPFDNVEKAAKDLEDRQKKDKKKGEDNDYWIVILTDGYFTKIENGKLTTIDKEIIKDKMVDLTKKSKDTLSIAYVYIEGGMPQDKNYLSGMEESRIFIPDEEGNVTERLIDIANKIYKRITIKNTGEYFEEYNDRVEISWDVPVEKMLILTQYEGAEISYSKEHDENVEDTKLELPNGNNKVFKQNTSYSFQGRDKAPGVEEKAKEDHVEKNFHYRFLKGTMHTLVPTDIFSFSGDKTVTVTGTIDRTVDIYYKPSVSIGIDYIQDDKPIEEHSADCKKNSQANTEACIQACDLELVLRIRSRDGEEEIASENELLHPELFEAYLRPAGKGEETEWEALETTDSLTYFCRDLEKGTYELKIITSWNEICVQTLEVQDRWEPVTMMLTDTNTVFLESPQNTVSDIKVKLLSGGEPMDSERAKHIVSVECESGNEDFEIKSQKQISDDTWNFQVELKDPKKHDIGEELPIHVLVTTDYVIGGINEHIQDFLLPITSGDFELSVKSTKSEAKGAIIRGIKGETVNIDYFCDNEKLTEEQSEKIEIESWTVEPETMGKKIVVDKKGNIYLKPGLVYWFFHKEDNVTVNFKLNYTRWNNKQSQEAVMELEISYLSRLQQFFILFGLIFLAGWVILCIAHKFTDSFIRKRKLSLVASGYQDQEVRFKRKGVLFIPFWRTAKICFKDTSGYYPTFSLKVKNNPQGDGYIITNYDAIGDSSRCLLGGKEINSSNNLICDSRKFEVIDKHENRHQLKLWE